MLIEHLKDLFADDPLLGLIRSEGLLQEFFGDDYFFEQITTEQTYSTKDAARLMQIANDHNIRNTLSRYHLNEYVQVRYINSRIALDYESVFKLKMIFFIRETLNKKPLQIAEYLGLIASTSDSPNKRNNIPNQGLDSRQEDKEEQMMYSFILHQMQRKEMLAFKLDVKEEQKGRELKRIDREIDAIIDEIELINDLKELREEHENDKIIQNERLKQLKSKMTFRNLFKKKWDDETISPKTIKEKINDKQIKKLTDKEKKLRKNIDEISTERKEVQEKMTREIDELKEELEQLEQKLEHVKVNIGEEQRKWLE